MTTSLPDTMLTAVLHKPLDVQLETKPLPEIGPADVLIKVMAVGVCGSDVHYYEHGRIGRYVVERPLILGHECSGIVVAAGSQVKKLKVDDRVAIEPGVTCGRCEACKEGRYNLCPEVEFMATPPVNGAFAQYIAHREDFVYPIPDHMSYEAAALIEPFSVGIHAASRAGLRPGASIAIMGMGPVGLMAVVAAKAFGAGTIIAADMAENRLEAARKLGATHTVQAAQADPVKAVFEYTGGKGADVAFETAGSPKALQAAVLSLKRGGALSIVGLPQQEGISLPVPFIVDNEIDLYGIFRYANTYEAGIRFLSSGIADVDALVTDRYPLEQAGEAMERARTNKQGSIKVMVYPNGK